jgi:dihydroxyacetone kinase
LETISPKVLTYFYLLGKRGIAGTVLVYKVLGAAALQGLDLD